MKKINTKLLTTLAVLTAMNIVLSRFCAINLWNQKYGVDFLSVAVAGMLYGPTSALVVAGLGDFVGALLFPFGPYFPGFTATACATGLVFGAFLHKKQSLPRIVGAVCVNQLFLSLFANTLWISILYGAPYGAQFVIRLPQCCVMLALQTVTICAVSRFAVRIGKRVTA